jgi:ribosomal protein S14
MKNFIKLKHFSKEQKLRLKHSKNEIFFSIHYILLQSKFSTTLTYYNFKNRMFNRYYSNIRNRCIITNNPRSVYRLLKIGKIPFSRKINSGSLVGFFRSV